MIASVVSLLLFLDALPAQAIDVSLKDGGRTADFLQKVEIEKVDYVQTAQGSELGVQFSFKHGYRRGFGGTTQHTAVCIFDAEFVKSSGLTYSEISNWLLHRPGHLICNAEPDEKHPNSWRDNSAVSKTGGTIEILRFKAVEFRTGLWP